MLVTFFSQDWLASLQFRVVVRWPISLVVTDDTLNAYSRIFRFLLQIHYAKWVLKSLALLKAADSKKPGKRSPTLHTFYTHRAQMYHIVTCVQQYMINRAVHGVWPKFQEHLDKLEETGDLNHLKEAHYIYLAETCRQLLLGRNSRPARGKIVRILATSIKIQGISREAMLQYRDQANADIAFLLTVLEEIVRQGVQLHLKDLLMSLNFNKWFTSKHSGTSTASQK